MILTIKVKLFVFFSVDFVCTHTQTHTHTHTHTHTLYSPHLFQDPEATSPVAI